MKKYQHALQYYIQSGKLSVYSTTLPGFNDVPGFGGIQLNDLYADQYFLNMCLYYAKGLAAYVTVGRVEEYILPDYQYVSAPTHSSFVSSVLARLSTAVPVTVTTTSKVYAHSVVHRAACSYALTSGSGSSGSSDGVSTTHTGNASSNADSGVVRAQLHVYGIEDPPGAFGAWGPGESNWGRGM